MRLLVTRPEADAHALAMALTKRGHEVLREPLLAVAFRDHEPIDLAGINGLIVTSRHSLQALARRPGLLDQARGLPLFAVGTATAAVARDLGFRNIVTGPGTAQELAQTIERHGSGPLLQLTGQHQAADLKQILRHRGLLIEVCTVYHMKAKSQLAPAVVAALRGQRIDGVILMSPRTAAVFGTLIQHHELDDVAAKFTYFCLSVAVAEKLRAALRPAQSRAGPAGANALTLKIPNHADAQELLALVELEAKQLSQHT